MSGSNLPWSKFYWGAWRGDAGLRLCSIEARGFWMELLCLMAASEKPGILLVSGRNPSGIELGSLCNVHPKTVHRLLRELDDAGVFSRTEDGLIFCRRMVKDAQEQEVARNNGRKGGNPNLRKHASAKPNGSGGGVNPPDNPPVNPPVKAESESESEREIPRARDFPPVPPAHARAHEADGTLQCVHVPPRPGLRVVASAGPLPEDWEPSGADWNYALDRDLDPAVIRDELRNWAGARAEARSDWGAMFRRFCDVDLEKRRRRTVESAAIRGGREAHRFIDARERGLVSGLLVGIPQ